MSQAPAQKAGLSVSLEEVRTLEQLRGQLMQLVRNIDGLQKHMFLHPEMPAPW
jgi:hypothetical protein